MKPKTIKKLTVITGATASGKTSLAIELAKKINAEIICADSRIVYRNLDIVSAKPNEEEKEGIVHHLIDIIEPDCEFSAGDFVLEAKKAIEKINSADKNIIIAGGTWFYIKSLLDEKELPECPINKELREELSKLSSFELWEKLSSLDLKRAQLIHPNNKDKIIRSIEMCEYLKQPVSEFQRKENKKDYTIDWFMIDKDRKTLYDRINERVDIMLKTGLYEEWQKNKELYPNSKVLFNTIGYKEFFELEKGLYLDFKTAVDKIKQHTRNFAKRQLTYFRSNNSIKKIKSIDEIVRELEC